MGTESLVKGQSLGSQLKNAKRKSGDSSQCQKKNSMWAPNSGRHRDWEAASGKCVSAIRAWFAGEFTGLPTSAA